MDGKTNEANAVTVNEIVSNSSEKEYHGLQILTSTCGHPVVTTSIKEEESMISTSMPSMVSLAGNLGNHPMALGNLVPVTTTTQLTGAIPEQLLVTVQSLNNGVVDTSDEMKIDSTQNETQQMSQVPKINGTHLTNAGLAAMMNLQGLTGIPQMATIGMPGLTNLSALGINHLTAAGMNASLVSNANNGNVVASSAPNSTAFMTQQPTTISQQPNQAPVAQVAMPQFILAGGQLLQGIQGAQLLIPTSSGVATQQILTIPVNQMANSPMVQLVTSNGQVLTTTLNNLQGLSQQAIPVGNASGSGIPTQQLVTNGLQNLTTAGQMTAIPQFVNANGQMVAITPQLITQPMVTAHHQGGNLVHIANQPQLTTENKTLAQAVINSTKPQVQQVSVAPSISPNVVTQSQPAQIQIATIGGSTQLTAQTVQQRTQPSQSGQIVQVATQSQIQTQQAVSTSTNSADIGNTISQSDANTVDGINLEEIKEFAKAFKIRRLSLGLTQTQVGQALSITEGPAYSQSAICRFEKLDITPKSAQKIKPVLERWMKEAEERYKNGAQNLTEFIGTEPSKKRKRRTSFTPQALEVLNQHFECNTHPSGAEMTELAEKLHYDREVVRVWFCNKRQALKNTIKKLKATSVQAVTEA